MINAETLDEATRALLPRRIAELVDVVGLTAALKLVELRGGVRLEVPKRAKPEHWLVPHIGIEALTKLAAYYSGECIEIDRCAKVLKLLKEREIVAEFAGGLSNAQLARKYQYTERGIRILRKRVEKTRPAVNLDLFLDFCND